MFRAILSSCALVVLAITAVGCAVNTDDAGEESTAAMMGMMPPRVGPSWSRTLIADLYHLEGFQSETWELYEKPAAALNVATSGALTNFPNDVRDGIVSRCQSFSEPLLKLHCASDAVHENLRDKFPVNGRNGLASYCRAMAAGFREVIWHATNHKNSWFLQITPFHVANLVSFKDDKGSTYEYVLDVGWFQHVLYPYNDTAKAFHLLNGNGQRFPHFVS